LKVEHNISFQILEGNELIDFFLFNFNNKIENNIHSNSLNNNGNINKKIEIENKNIKKSPDESYMNKNKSDFTHLEQKTNSKIDKNKNSMQSCLNLKNYQKLFNNFNRRNKY